MNLRRREKGKEEKRSSWQSKRGRRNEKESLRC